MRGPRRSSGRSATPASRRTSGSSQVLVVQYAQALYYGPTPVPDAIRRARTCSPRLAGTPTFEAGLATTLAGLHAMEGRFPEARELYADSVAVYDEFGLRFRRAVRTIVGAQIETLAGDLGPQSASSAPATRCSRRWASARSARRSPRCSPMCCRCKSDDAEAERFRRDRAGDRRRVGRRAAGALAACARADDGAARRTSTRRQTLARERRRPREQDGLPRPARRLAGRPGGGAPRVGRRARPPPQRLDEARALYGARGTSQRCEAAACARPVS